MPEPQIRLGERHQGVAKPAALSRDLADSIWVACEFKDCELSGAHISGSVFSDCVFDDVVLYWCHAFRSTFIGCTFRRCDLRGSFDEARFVRSRFEHCQVGDNNLGGTTEWENAVAVECVVIGDPLPLTSNDGY